MTAGIVALAGASWIAWSSVDSSAAAPAPPASPVDAMQHELLQANIGQPGDPALDAAYAEISTQFFSGKLPSLPVRWEPGLARVGALSAQAFTLEGMFGHVGKRSVILLNTTLEDDDAAMRRALCHEIVHAYLFSTGDNTTDHGPSFQALLKHLSEAGAFEGIMATDEERSQLRAWLDEESQRIDAERKLMDALGDELEQQRTGVDHAMAEANAKAAASVTAGTGGLTKEQVDALNADREAYNQRAAEANQRLDRDRADLEHFNQEVARYNLMLVYPDGLDEHALVKPKPPATR